MDFLKNVGVSEYTISEMQRILNEATLYNLKANAENCLAIILYLQKIGVSNIDELLLFRPEWFLNVPEKFIIKFERRKPQLINQINNGDYLEIEL